MKNKITIAVDFDGTLVVHQFPKIGVECPGAVSTIKALQQNGARVFLWTMRDGEHLEAAKNWCKERGLELDAYNVSASGWGTGSPKQFANLYIDDSAMGCPMTMTEDGPGVDWWRISAMLYDAELLSYEQMTNIKKEIHEQG